MKKAIAAAGSGLLSLPARPPARAAGCAASGTRRPAAAGRSTTLAAAGV